MTAHPTDIGDRAHRLAVAVARALVEDSACRGIGLNARQRRQARAVRGIRLPAGLAASASAAWAADLHDIRICLGKEADRFLDSVGMPACCVGSRVFVAGRIMAEGERTALALAHELTHLAAARVPDVARGWDAAIHAELSDLACTACRMPLDAIARAVDLSWGEFIQGVRNASSNMDIRQRLAHPVDTGTYLGTIAAGEGPRHGEGFNYTSTDLNANRQRNLAEQVRHAHLAAQEIMGDTPLFTILSIEAIRVFLTQLGRLLGGTIPMPAVSPRVDTCP